MISSNIFVSVSGLSTAKGLSFAFQTNDPNTNDFKLAILRLHENNFLGSLERKWWENANQCPEEEDTSKSLSYLIYYILKLALFRKDNLFIRSTYRHDNNLKDINCST